MDNKDFLTDGLTNEDIINEIKKIIERKNNDEIRNIGDEMERYEKIRNEFLKFAERYPMLFELSIRNENFDWNSLNYMLNMRNKIINNEMSSENATKIVGQEWFNKHIDPTKFDKNKNKKRKY
jgi:hypothetical protein